MNLPFIKNLRISSVLCRNSFHRSVNRRKALALKSLSERLSQWTSTKKQIYNFVKQQLARLRNCSLMPSLKWDCSANREQSMYSNHIIKVLIDSILTFVIPFRYIKYVSNQTNFLPFLPPPSTFCAPQIFLCICPQNVLKHSLRKERKGQVKFVAPPKEML